ncbi:MAG: peptide ABC transporter substrate-binding protein [Chloroflexi bacterium]|nr:peptide ABC transporter substrate-binding protein [Chloroflexota bacterium]
MNRKLFALLAVLILASVVLSACGSATPTEAPATAAPTEAPTAAAACTPAGTEPIAFPSGGKSVTGAWSQEPDNIVPYYTQMSYAIWITQLTLVGLGEWDDKGAFVAELAADVPTADNGGVSADGLTITWKLKPCLFWSDGEPLTSADVKFTWQSIMDPKNVPLSRIGYDKIASIDTPDDQTVVIKFSELYPGWQTLFTQGPNNSGAILPKHILDGKTGLEKDPFTHQPTVSSGPFVISEWVAGDRMTLLPNPNFYKGRAKLDQVQIKFVPDPETALAALKTGDIDWYPDFSESDIVTVGALEPAIHLKVVPGADFEHYFFNLGTTAGVTLPDGTVVGKSDVNGFCPFKDVNVRKAITLGIDRQTIVDTLLAGKTIVPATQWPNSSWTNTSLTPDKYDPAAAAALLDAAGYKVGADGIRAGTCDGKPVKLSFNFETTTKQIRVDIALAVQSDLKKIGIEFKPIHTPAGTFFAGYTDGGNMPLGKFDMAGYTTGFYPDPMSGVLDSYSCSTVPSKDSPSGTNNYHLCDPKLDDLMKAVNATADPAARKTALDAVQKYIFDQYYVIMMYARANVYGYVDRFVPAPFGFFSNMNWNAEDWTVK